MFQHKMSHSLLSSMIKTNTVSSPDHGIDQSNLPLCEILANILVDLNFSCQITPVPDHPEKWNLIAKRPGTKSESGGLMFSGHCDTVPADESLWQADPWQLSQTDNRLTGLGVTDMKSFFATVIDAISLMPMQHHSPVTIVATADEETSMAGARALTSEVVGTPDLNILGEPTNLTPVLSHKGYLAFTIELTGPGGHSSQHAPELQCLEAATAVMQQLLMLRDELQKSVINPSFAVPVSTLNLGRLNAGDIVNRLCSNATLEFDIRPLPGLATEELTALLEKRIEQALSRFKVSWKLKPTHTSISPFHTSVTNELVASICKSCACEHSNPVSYVTEAPLFEQLGIPTLIMGPGSIDQAHQPNEWLDTSQIRRAQEVYPALLMSFCY
ncbi:acetylornithine deacetylase [Pleionea sediminis]|uniref:acetylornithine deacetylase n=1 Tax=Pleionea sediminis TaxID=2569479 RepID=UPI0013DE402D|nr:acetylornithine deacetylase [Pleionea sediminis]